MTTATAQEAAVTEAWRPGLTYTAELEAEVDDRPIAATAQSARGVYNSADHIETHEGLPFVLKSDAYSAGQETHTHIVPKIEFDRTANASGAERQHTLKSVLALYDKTAGRTLLAKAQWAVRFEKVAGQSDKTRLLLQSVELGAGASLDPSHDWYMMGFFGGAEISGGKVSFKLNRALKNANKLGDYESDMSLSKVSAGDRLSMVVPFATGWRQIQVDGTKITPKVTAGQTRTDRMTFTPQAAFVELRVSSYMSQPMTLDPKITMESNCLVTEGTYDFSSLGAGDSRFNSATPSIEPNAYWTPEGTKKPGVTDEWISVNGVHFVSTFTLKDFPTQINARSGNQAMEVAGRYILAVMPTDPAKSLAAMGKSVNNALIQNFCQTLFYGHPTMKKATGAAPTTQANSYSRDPKQLTPEFGTRYLLGSTGDEFKGRRSYSMTLRLLRPMLPIERLYVHNGLELGSWLRYADAQKMPAANMRAELKNAYRLPYWTEIGTLLTVNYNTLTSGSVQNWGTGYSRIASVIPNSKRVLLEPKPYGMYDMVNFYSWRDNMIYGIMYIDPDINTQNYRKKEGGYTKPGKPGGYERTNMYKVAVRISFPTDQKMKLDTYYIGSNLDINNQFYYLMHPSFWATVDQNAIISRTLPFNTRNDKAIYYWGEGVETAYENLHPPCIPILRSGASLVDDRVTRDTRGSAYTLYGLKERSW